MDVAVRGTSSQIALLLSVLQIMKSDEDVRMISAEAPVLFAKVRGQVGCMQDPAV